MTAPQAEAALLGSVLVEPAVIAEALEHVKPDDFADANSGRIFAAMAALYDRGVAPDVVTVCAELEQRGDLEAVGGSGAVSMLGAAEGMSVFVGQYAAIVAADARRRRIATAAAQVREAALAGATEDEIGYRLEVLAGSAAGIGRPSARAAQTLEDFLADPAPVRWAIPSIAVTGSVTAIVGPPESFKSFLLMQAGLAAAGIGDVLGLQPEPSPFVYVSAEKAAATVRDRFRRLADGQEPAEPILILHRAGVTFGRGWDLVRRTLDGLGRPALVGLDTLASLSGPGFDENSGKDMQTALSAMRGIVSDFGATVLVSHHPAKHSEGEGGSTLRGHSSLFGEVDGVVAMRRFSRDGTAGTMVADPKDADRLTLTFEWDVESFRLRAGGTMPLTIAAIAQAIEEMDGSADGKQLVAAFPGHPRPTVYRRIGEAVEAHAIVRIGGRGAYVYTVPGSSLTGWAE